MNYVGIFLIVAIVSGLIGYLGNELGRFMGRRKHSLFGLRPKRSADLVAASAGALIGMAALAILLLTQSIPAASTAVGAG